MQTRNRNATIEDINQAVRGWISLEIGDYDRAIADYTQAIQLKPDNADVRILRGLAISDNYPYRILSGNFGQTRNFKIQS